jgi:hypothetical protein
MRRVLSGVTVGMLALALAALLWQRRDASARPVVAVTDGAPDIHRELADIKSELARLKLPAARVDRPAEPAAAAVAKQPAPARDGDESLSREDAEALRAEKRRLDALKLQQEAQRQARDPGWSTEAERKMLDAFSSLSSELPGANMESCVCGTTLCEVVVTHDDRTSQRRMAVPLSRTPPFTTEIFYQYDRSSVPLKTTLYVAREGYQLPLGDH